MKSTAIHTSLILSLLMFLGACASSPAPEAKEVYVDPLRFEKVVNGYLSSDSVSMPPTNAVLFVGSSSIHGWKDVADHFPELTVINRGMGGSHMSDLIFHMDKIVFPYRPNAILVYEGDNDIAAGKSPEIVLRDYLIFVEKVLEKQPSTPIFFISIKPSLARVDHMEAMAQANALIKAHTETVENLHFIDIFYPMLGEDGKPLPSIFKDDGLHMNADGYAIWAEAIREGLGL